MKQRTYLESMIVIEIKQTMLGIKNIPFFGAHKVPNKGITLEKKKEVSLVYMFLHSINYAPKS